LDITGFILLAVVVVLVGYTIFIYNGLVRLKHGVAKAWSNIDVLLKQRHDELPKLVEVCKQYMGYEKDTLERVIAARSAVSAARDAGDMAKLGQAEASLRMGLGNLFAVAEAYPDLKADQTFNNLQTRISALENQIADRREFYNEQVNLNNVRIEQFPDPVIARLFKFGPRALLEFDARETADIDVRALFGS
jgi:LemA protein